MCWNATVSINTYFFSLFASIFAYMNNVINIPTFLLFQSFFTMQLIEYFVWSKTFSNRLLSQLAMFLVISQPIFSILRIPPSTMYRHYLLGSYILIIILWFTLFFPIDKVDYRMIPHKNGHLAWKWLIHDEIVFLWVFFLLSPTFILNNPLFWFGIISFLITFSLYSKTQTWGSLWCWIANAISIGLIFKVFWKDLCIGSPFPKIDAGFT
jgi:hypothetical protein